MQKHSIKIRAEGQRATVELDGRALTGVKRVAFDVGGVPGTLRKHVLLVLQVEDLDVEAADFPTIVRAGELQLADAEPLGHVLRDQAEADTLASAPWPPANESRAEWAMRMLQALQRQEVIAQQSAARVALALLGPTIAAGDQAHWQHAPGVVFEVDHVSEDGTARIHGTINGQAGTWHVGVHALQKVVWPRPAPPR